MRTHILFTKNIIRLVKEAATSAGAKEHGILLRIVKDQKRAARQRKRSLKKGMHIPQIMIASITGKCSMNCLGCFHKAHARTLNELSDGDWLRIFRSASELGISVFIIAGGEPFGRPEILTGLSAFSDVLIAVYTNLMTLDTVMLDLFSKSRNLIPVISLEGGENATDSRRGKGAFASIMNNMLLMRDAGIFFGTSITAWSENLEEITAGPFIGELIASGSSFFSFVEYVPADPAAPYSVLTRDDLEALEERMKALRRECRKPFFLFPGNEEQYGGCLAAGRGFFHVAPDGAVEPCPFAPVSDSALPKTGMIEALNSPLFKKIRNKPLTLTEKNGGCSLRSERNLPADDRL